MTNWLELLLNSIRENPLNIFLLLGILLGMSVALIACLVILQNWKQLFLAALLFSAVTGLFSVLGIAAIPLILVALALTANFRSK